MQQTGKVTLEQNFKGIKPVDFYNLGRMTLNKVSPELKFEFKGSGFCLSGNMAKSDWGLEDKILEVEVYLDGILVEIAKLPTDFTKRRYDLMWNYEISNGNHLLRLKLLNPIEGYGIKPDRLIVYQKIL